VNDDDDVLHQSKVRSNQTAPGSPPRRRFVSI
jgi:hypothetical protein